MKVRNSDSDERVPVCAVVTVIVGAVHRAVAVRDYPRPKCAVLWFVGLRKVSLQPLVLTYQLLDPVLEKVEEFGGETDEMGRAHVPTVHHRVVVTGHREP